MKQKNESNRHKIYPCIRWPNCILGSVDSFWRQELLISKLPPFLLFSKFQDHHWHRIHICFYICLQSYLQCLNPYLFNFVSFCHHQVVLGTQSPQEVHYSEKTHKLLLRLPDDCTRYACTNAPKLGLDSDAPNSAFSSNRTTVWNKEQGSY